MSGSSSNLSASSTPAPPTAEASIESLPPVLDANTEAKIAFRSLMLGLFAAATYSVANMALRGLAKSDGGPGWDMWVAGTKALPTFLIAVTLLSIRRVRGLTSFAAWEFVWPIAVAALFNQLGGNFAFQMSLRAIGLAISVPICFASIICSGAIVGRTVLGDQVSIRTGIAMALMVASIVFLSTAAQSRSAPAPVNTAQSEDVEANDDKVLEKTMTESITKTKTQGLSVTAGVGLSILSGLCYGVTGVFIRKAVRSQMPVAATLFLFSAAGFLVLCPISLTMLPLEEIARTRPSEWLTMATAGTFNALGFFAITHAMRHLTISRANVINASQNAMCAIGAVAVFNETLSGMGILGIALTITGLLVLDRK